MWNALPLTEYCVDINTTTLDSTQTVVLDSECGLVNEYIFTYSNPISVCDRFSFTVTPTEGEMRGRTSEPVTGFFTRVEGSTKEPHRIRESGDNKSVGFKAIIPSCTRFTWYRVDSDLLTPSISGSITDSLFDGSLSFSLPTDKMTEYSVTLTDENGIDLVFENIKISTFDVQEILVSECPGGGCISVSIEYVEGTLSPGALVCVIRIIDGELDFTNIKVMTIPRSRSDNFTILAVPSGNYSVMTFDFECNSLPRMPISIAADSGNISVAVSSGDGGQPPSSEGVSVTKLPNGDAQVTCADSDVVCLVLFQSTINLDRILVALIDSFASSTSFSVSDTFANGHVIVYSWNSSQFIFDGKVSLIRQLNPPTSAPSTLSPTDPPPVTGSQFPLPGVIAGITVVVILLLLVVIVVGVICLKKRKKMQNEVTIQAPESGGQVHWCSTFPGIEQTNEAYAPVLKKNIAYEQTKKPRRQRIDNSQAPVTIEGEYESIEPVHEYEDVLPKTN
ncbi:uncharacterized protein LOC135339596 [Halichondria panicea]|uniref:uncharacterized protein LOC135339596 n=1 Tax=Halichondria panicea TaxID=6063 RepID=UPI00312B35F9